MKRSNIAPASGVGSILSILILIVILHPVFNGTLQADKPFKIDIHGYLSQGFLISNHNNFLAETSKGSFQFNELGINFSTELTDKLRVGIQLAALDLGDTGNNKVHIDWAYADYKWRDWLGFRVGQIKLPLGIYNKTRDIDMFRTFILLPQGVYGESYRDTQTALKGLGLYGRISMDAFGGLSYQAMMGTIDVALDGSTTKNAEARGDIEIDAFHLDRVTCAALDWETPLPGLKLSVSMEDFDLTTDATLTQPLTIPIPEPPYEIPILPAGTPITIESRNFIQWVTSMEWIISDLVLAAEFFQQQHEVLMHTGIMEPIKNSIRLDSYYFSASYRFNKTIKAGSYYSWFRKKRFDQNGVLFALSPEHWRYQKDICLALQIDLNPNWLVKLEGHMMNGTGMLYLSENRDESGNPNLKKNWALAAVKMTFSF